MSARTNIEDAQDLHVRLFGGPVVLVEGEALQIPIVPDRACFRVR
jgi:hypothetical protein